MNKSMILLLVVAVSITVALYWLTGDSKALVSGDLANNQQEMTTLAQALLDGDSLSEDEQALLNKYSSTYEIRCWEEGSKSGSGVDFLASGTNTTTEGTVVGVYYSPDDVMTAYPAENGDSVDWTAEGSGYRWERDSGSGYVEALGEQWYYFEAELAELS